MRILKAEIVVEDHFPEAECKNCGDIGKFEDLDGNEWECWCANKYQKLLLESGYTKEDLKAMSDEECQAEWDDLCTKSPTA